MDLSIKDAERKKHSALLIGGTKNAYPSSTDTIPPARKFSSFLPIQKKKKKKKKKKKIQTFLSDEFKDIMEKYQKKIFCTFKV